MADPTIKCDYCGRRVPVSELETKEAVPPHVPERIVCKDREACAAAEEQGHKARVRELRKMQREGEELSEAEKQELAEG